MVKITKRCGGMSTDFWCNREEECHCGSWCPLLEPGCAFAGSAFLAYGWDKWEKSLSNVARPAVRVNCGCVPVVWEVEVVEEGS